MNRRILFIALLLTFAGGYADAASYLLTESFTGQLTGNVILMILHLLEGAWRSAGSNGLAVAAFVTGLGLAEWMETGSGAPERPQQMRVPLLIEAVLLLIATVCRFRSDLIGNDLTIAFLCLGLGLQNGALRQCGEMTVHTTFMTGMATTLLTAVVKRVGGTEHSEDKSKRPLMILAGILSVFMVGVVTGGWFNYHFKAWGLPGVLIPLAVALAATRND